MKLKKLLELDQKINEQMLEHKLKNAEYENRQAIINLGVQIISQQMTANTIALLRLQDLDSYPIDSFVK